MNASLYRQGARYMTLWAVFFSYDSAQLTRAFVFAVALTLIYITGWSEEREKGSK